MGLEPGNWFFIVKSCMKQLNWNIDYLNAPLQMIWHIIKAIPFQD